MVSIDFDLGYATEASKMILALLVVGEILLREQGMMEAGFYALLLLSWGSNSFRSVGLTRSGLGRMIGA